LTATDRNPARFGLAEFQPVPLALTQVQGVPTILSELRQVPAKNRASDEKKRPI